MARAMRRARLTTIFSKLPRAGEVKTRLVPPLSPADAAGLAEAMLADCVARSAACADFQSELCVHPPGAEGWFRARFPEIGAVRAQSGRELGERLARHFDAAFAREPLASAIVVGSDAPEVPLARLLEAHQRLADGADAVFGPDRGGGYYLVGLRRPCGALFTEVSMSTPGMYARTLELARDRRLVLAELEPGDDVDTGADLRRLLRAARRARGGELIQTRRWLRAWRLRTRA